MALQKDIPCCPLLSAGTDVDKICMQDSCAWYLKKFKICSVYMLAHEAAMNVQAKQAKKQ